MRKRLYVDNFAPATTREALEKLFGQSGTVESVTIPDHPLDKNSTHALVVMADDNEAKAE